MRSFIPNALTASNLILGIFSIMATIQGQYFNAAVLILGSMIADALDGRVARYFNVSSEFGKQLDSLCDLVSFGVAPAILAYVFYLNEFGWIGSTVAAAFATCGALRLARFNVNAGTVKGYFVGLPIPASGCIVATFIMLGYKPPGWIFPVMIATYAYLMISTVRYPDFKGKGEKVRFIPVAVSILVGVYILTQFEKNSVIFVPFFVYSIFGFLNSTFRYFDEKNPN